MARIKICGITNKKDALAASALGAWAVGFIFYKKSPRYIAPEQAAAIIRALPKSVLPVGVFVNASAQEIKRIAQTCRLKAVQFHGDESPAFCAQFKNVLTFKALRVKSAGDLRKASRFKTDFILFDAYQKGSFGGTGKSFNWLMLKKGSPAQKKIILSGGLNPDNIAYAVTLKNVHAFDVSSGVERRPGKKCARLLRKFFKQAQIQKSKVKIQS